MIVVLSLRDHQQKLVWHHRDRRSILLLARRDHTHNCSGDLKRLLLCNVYIIFSWKKLIFFV